MFSLPLSPTGRNMILSFFFSQFISSPGTTSGEEGGDEQGGDEKGGDQEMREDTSREETRRQPFITASCSGRI